MRLSQSIAILLLPLKAMACGLDWSPPVSHFENVDYQGHVHIVRKLGEVEKLPIYLIFNSSYGISPYVGSGFEIPFLESRIWQVDENRFQMKSPSGWLWIFQRTKVPNVLEGNAGWKGLIKDDTITVWAPCGDKMSFKNGRIISMQVKENKIDYTYKGNRVETIGKNGKTIIEIKVDQKTNAVSGINITGTNRNILLHQAKCRPVFESNSLVTVIKRMESTLEEVTTLDGRHEAYDFSTTKDMCPTLTINGNIFKWDLKSKCVKSDGNWMYTIKSPQIPSPSLDYAEIERTLPNGKSESWFQKLGDGFETVKTLDGQITTRHYFTSGVLSGQFRSLTSVKNGSLIKSEKRTYDELGRPIKHFINGELASTMSYKQIGDCNLEIDYNENNQPTAYVVSRAGKAVEYFEANTFSGVVIDRWEESVINPGIYYASFPPERIKRLETQMQNK